MFQTKKDKLFAVLGGFFICNALIGEMIGGKLIQLGPFDMSIGIIPWPIVFLSTDLINEYFGREGVKKLTFLTSGLIIYVFLMLFLAIKVPASGISPVLDEQFQAVFGQSMWIIVGSIIAFVLSQLLDVAVFWFLRQKTGEKHLWLRATGSTVFSQLIDTFIVAGIGFYLPGKIDFASYINIASTGYLAKLLIAIALTPLIYIGHKLIDNYLGKEGHAIIENAAHASIASTK